jgi:uncharacterized protein
MRYAKCVKMKAPKNPFVVTGYHGPKWFCNRTEETSKIISAWENGRNLTLMSIRRMGKTGLIHHVFFNLRKNKGLRLIYLDILPARNVSDLVRIFTKALILDEQRRPGNYLKKLGRLFAGLQVKLTLSPQSGMPELEFGYRSTDESMQDLEQLFTYIGAQTQEYLIAFDEFQQIVQFPETNIEASLRAQVQTIKNARFIFSGSHKHLLGSIFSDSGRPFYQSTDMLHLKALESSEYSEFIINHLWANKQQVTHELAASLLDQLRHHTFYVQFFFNRLYESGIKKPEWKDAESLLEKIIKEREHVFYDYRNLLTTNQFLLLQAIAREKKISQPTSQEFIETHRLGQPSSVNRSLKALLEKEMIYQEQGVYYVYDVFFSKWLEKT